MPGRRNAKTSKNADRASENGNNGKTQADSVLKQGIWGLVYLSIGALLAISMLWQLADGSASHILGPYLGTSMSLGMFYIFGRITAFAFAAAVCYIGVAKFTLKPLRMKLLLFISVLMVELCLLLAVRYMPELSGNGLMATANSVGYNFVGLMMISALSPLFGGRTFGPYFIVSLLMAITVMVGLRVRPQDVWAFASKWLTVAGAWVKKAFTEVKAGIKDSPDIRQAGGRDDKTESDDSGAADTKARVKPSKKGGKAAASDEDAGAVSTNGADKADDIADDNKPAPADEKCGVSSDLIVDADGDDGDNADKTLSPEDEAKKHFDEQIKQYRDMKKEGVKIEILAVETPDIEVDDDDAPLPRLDSGESDFDQLFDTAKTDDGDTDGTGAFEVIDPPKPVKPYVLPSPDILSDPPPVADMFDKEEIERTSHLLERTLMNFKVEGTVVSVSPGPVVTRYEIVLAPGVRVSKVTSLQDDLMMAVGAEAIRIQAPIPGKMAVGIELPNAKRQNVHFKHILVSNEFKKNFSLPVIIGSNISGIPYVTDITKTPHLLVAGQTGSGKSVCMNSLICTMLMTKKPDELRLIMIDPKQVEFASFENIPHLLSPVVTEAKEAVKALQWGVMEMERRYKLLTGAGVRKIDDFNAKVESGKLADILSAEDNKPMPLIVIIIDELADLMMTAPKDVEGLIARITQKARAAGIHMIIATQRPSVNVITGLIKANLPSRIAFRTVSQIDSRTILDQGGSEKLLGMGDMLFLRNGAQNVERFHGAYIPDDDVEKIVAAIKEQEVEVESIGRFNDIIKDPEEESGAGDDDGGGNSKRDDLFADAAQLVVSTGLGSTSLLQRRMEIGFARAGRIMDQLERAGIVGPSKGGKAREVLMRPEELADYL